MPTVNEGASADVFVEAGKMLVVSSSGETYIDRLTVLSDAGYSSDRIVDGMKAYPPLGVAFSVRIRAVRGSADYTVSYPNVPAADVLFRRSDAGAIDALIDPKTGQAVPLGTGEATTVSWGDLADKPAVIAAGQDQEAARAAIGAGTSSLAIGTTGATAAAGDHSHDDATTARPGFMSGADKAKLDAIASGATANATDAELRNRSTHTGEQSIATITGLQAALDHIDTRLVALEAAQP